jgi:hypothetical protein
VKARCYGFRERCREGFPGEPEKSGEDGVLLADHVRVSVCVLWALARFHLGHLRRSLRFHLLHSVLLIQSRLGNLQLPLLSRRHPSSVAGPVSSCAW